MPRGNQIARQWRILRLLEGARDGLSARELHDQLDRQVSERTIFRDLQHLQDAGFPLREHRGRWCVLAGHEGGYIVPVGPTELLALLFSEELLAPIRSAEVVCALSELREKVTAMLAPTARAYAAEIKQHLVATLAGPGDYGDSPAVRVIEDAIHREHCLRIRYWSPRGDITERRVDPYLLWYADGLLYLVGWCHLRDAVRTFLVDRMRQVEVLDEPFDVVEGFDARDFTGSGLGAWSGERHRVTLWFSPPVAHLAGERRYHPTQAVTAREDGGVLVTMHVAGLPHVAAWVASFGGQIVARAPDTLVTMVQELHRRGLAAHDAASQPRQ